MNEHPATQSLLLCVEPMPPATDPALNARRCHLTVIATAPRNLARYFFHPLVYLACLAGLLFGCRASDNAAADVDFKSPFYALSLSPTNPAIACLSVDGLGQGRLGQNPVFVESQPAPPWQIQKLGAKQLACRPVGADLKSPAAWEFEFGKSTFFIRSRFIEGQATAPLVLTFDQHSNHATLLGLMQPH